MLKRIIGIMEQHHVLETWPDYDEFYVDDDTFLVLETDTSDVKSAYLIEVYTDFFGKRQIIRFDLEIPKEFPIRWFVNKYQLTREDGGPEEGGWSWDCHTPLKSIECTDEKMANEIFKVRNSKIDHEDQERNPYYNVNSPGHEYVQIENFDGTFNEPRRPHYE